MIDRHEILNGLLKILIGISAAIGIMGIVVILIIMAIYITIKVVT